MSTIRFGSDALNSLKTDGEVGAHGLRVGSDAAGKVHEDAEAQKESLALEGDVKEKQVYGGWVLFWLAYQSIGVIYGDIGTSPLYVYSSTFVATPSYDDLLGVLSLIIWSLTLIVSVKYVLIVLRADDQGEGGTFAVFSLLSRYANIVKRDPKEESMVKMERYLTSDLDRPGRTLRSGIEHSMVVRAILKTMGVLGVALVMSDGVLTPAQSVLGAIQGLRVVNPDITTGTVIGVSCAIILLLFLVQPLGTSKIASTFAPIVVVWLAFNAGFGIYNMALFDHSVLKAFSPYFAGEYLVRTGTEGWKSLGGVLLAFTGVEALFADLGAFSMNAIQLSWLCFTYPCLLLAYIGQAAYISADPTGDAWSNPFFNTVPPGMFYPSLVMAILAAIVASQAIITATFQLLAQIMKLSYFPHIKMVHTSKVFHGQIYIPIANWLLLIGTVIVTAVYNNTTQLGNAYGVCVILVTFITTCMISLVALIVWRLNPFVVLFVWLVFAALDGAFLSSTLLKVPNGAWFTLVLAAVLSSMFILWRFGKEQQWKVEAEDRYQPSRLIIKGEDGQLRLTPDFGGGSLTMIKGFGIFFDKIGDMTPAVFSQFLSKFLATPEVVVFFHLRPLDKPYVTSQDRYTITRTVIPNCFRVVVRHGYSEEVLTEDLASLIYEQLRSFIIHEGSTHRDPATVDEPPASSTASSAKDIRQPGPVASSLAQLENAYHSQVVYIAGKVQLRIRPGTGAVRRVILGCFLWIRENTGTRITSMKVPNDQLVQIGFIKNV